MIRLTARLCVLVVLPAALSVARGGEPAFAEKPKVSADGENIRIEFAAASRTDAAVEIINKEGKVVRHLAAGMLGPKAPPPFKTGLKQSLVWDRKDDAGKPVAGPCRARVGLGLTAKLDRFLGWGGPLYGEVKALAAGAGGRLRVLHVGRRKRDERAEAYFSVFGRDGKYLGTILPHDPSLKGDEGHGVKTLKPEGVGTVPAAVFRANTKANPDIYHGKYRYKGKLYPSSYSLRQGAASSAALGLVMVRTGGAGRRLIAVAPDGTVSSGPGLPAEAAGAVSIAALPGGKSFLVSAGGKLYLAAWGEEKVKPFLPAGGKALKAPGAVASDAAGQVYVADGDRVAVFKAGGAFVKALAVEAPGCLAVDPKLGALYVVSKGNALLKLSPAGKVLARLAVPRDSLIALGASAGGPVVWVAPTGTVAGLWRVLEKDGKLVKAGEVRGDGMRTSRYWRVVAHPERDEIFLKRYFRGRVRKSGNILRMDGVTGELTPIPVTAHEIALDAKGNIYVTYNKIPGPDGPTSSPITQVRKYDREGKPVPFDGKKKGEEKSNEFSFPSQIRGSGEGGRGLAIAANGDIYVLHYDPYDQGRPKPHYGPGPTWVSVFGPDGKRKKWHLIGGFTQGASGVGVDRAGNVYVADAIKPVGQIYPAAYRKIKELPTSKVNVKEDAPAMPGEPWIWDGGPNWFFMLTGTMLKFGPEGGKLWWKRGYKTEEPPKFEGPVKYWRVRQPGRKKYDLRAGAVRVKGEKWGYFGVSPVPQGSGGGFGFPVAPFVKSGNSPRTHAKHCVCHQARFALDGHGRLIIPDVMRFSVTVIDSRANELLRFGGFTRLRGRGPGSPVPQPVPPAISFAWAPYLAVNRHAVYVIDSKNRRIVKVKLGYRAEEIRPVP